MASARAKASRTNKLAREALRAILPPDIIACYLENAHGQGPQEARCFMAAVAYINDLNIEIAYQQSRRRTRQTELEGLVEEVGSRVDALRVAVMGVRERERGEEESTADERLFGEMSQTPPQSRMKWVLDSLMARAEAAADDMWDLGEGAAGGEEGKEDDGGEADAGRMHEVGDGDAREERVKGSQDPGRDDADLGQRQELGEATARDEMGQRPEGEEANVGGKQEVGEVGAKVSDEDTMMAADQLLQMSFGGESLIGKDGDRRC